MAVYLLIGHNLAHGYSVNDDEFSSHAGVLGPQTSSQFQFGASSNTNYDSVSPRDEMDDMRHQSFVSPQREPVRHENNEDAISVASLIEEMGQSKPDSGHEPDKFSEVPSTPSVQKYEHERSDYQQPFGLLVKEHAQKKPMEGISFSTIRDFEQFIETMKRSFLMPGSDVSRHFQTARGIMENEMASKAQKIKGEPDMGYGSSFANEASAHEASEKVQSEPLNTMFEQSEEGAKYHMPSESLSVPDPVDSTASLIPTSVYDSQGLGSALHPHSHLGAPEHVSSNYGSFDNVGISVEKPDIFTSADVQNEDVQSTSYKLPKRIPSGSFFGEDFSFNGHVTVSPVNPLNSPSQDISYFPSKTSNITPLKSEKNIQQPRYTPHSKDSSAGNQKQSGGFELPNVQSEELGRVTPANVLSAPNPQSLNSYGKSLYVSAPRGQLYIREYLPKHRKMPAPLFQPYQPTFGEESKDIKYTSTVPLPVSSSSVSSSSDNLLPPNSSGHVGVRTSSPHDAQDQAFNRKQLVRSHQVFTVKPSSSLHDSSRPSILTDQAKDERSDIPEQTLVSVSHKPKQMTDNSLIPISGGLGSSHWGVSSVVGTDYASSLTNLAPTSASETAFSRLLGNKVMSRNLGIKNVISDRFLTGDIRAATNPLSSFSLPQRRGMSLNGGYVGATRAGLLQTLMQQTKVRKRPANVNEELGNMAYQSPQWLSASKVSDSTLSGVFWRNDGNTKRLPPETGPRMSTPSVNAYVVKSRNSYVRGKVSISKTHYAPYQLVEDNW